MSHYRRRLGAALRMVELHPEWPAIRVAEMLTTRHGSSPTSALAIAHRAISWRQGFGRACARRRHSVLPGEANGVFENVIRVIEDSEWSIR